MLLRNSLWNITGAALPALAALATVPLLIHALGAEGYGIVTIVSSIVGYFAVLDINMSAGAIKYLAESHAADDARRFSETFWFGAFFYGLLGLIGALGIYFGADILVKKLFDMSPSAHDASILALKIGALGFLFTQVQGYLLIVPQSLQRFDRSAQSEALFGIFVNVISVVVAYAGGGITGVIAARVGVSLLNVIYLVFLIKRLDLKIKFYWPGKEVRRSLTSFSAYAYLSKLASTLHQHGDKLIVGAVAGPVALTFYTVPVTLASRILGLTYRMSSVIYPRASALAASDRMQELRPIYLGAMRYITYINLIALGLIILAGDEFLRRWVGKEFVAQGYPVLVIMTTAILIDSLTNIPSMVNDALGHPRVSGRFALARGIIGVGLVYFGALNYGIVGAATGHLMSSLLMGVLFLIFVHGRTVPISLADTLREGMGRSLLVGLLIVGCLFPLKWLVPPSLLGTTIIASAALVALCLAGLAFIVGVEERATLAAAARRLRS
jgi:O-antigen/teichoic acid export membrane protein